MISEPLNSHIKREFLLHPENEVFVRRNSRVLPSEAEVKRHIEKLEILNILKNVRQGFISLTMYSIFLSIVAVVLSPLVISSVLDPVMDKQGFFDLIFAFLLIFLLLFYVFPGIISSLYGAYIYWLCISDPHNGLYQVLLAASGLYIGEITNSTILNEISEHNYELKIYYQADIVQYRDSKTIEATYTCSLNRLLQVGDKVVVLYWDQDLNCLL